MLTTEYRSDDSFYWNVADDVFNESVKDYDDSISYPIKRREDRRIKTKKLVRRRLKRILNVYNSSKAWVFSRNSWIDMSQWKVDESCGRILGFLKHRGTFLRNINKNHRFRNFSFELKHKHNTDEIKEFLNGELDFVNYSISSKD